MKSYVSDILESLKYLHNEGIVHCDLKLENILANTFQDEDKIPIVKVCDFGLSHIKDREANTFIMEQKSGTHSYIAPEVKNVSNQYIWHQLTPIISFQGCRLR